MRGSYEKELIPKKTRLLLYIRTLTMMDLSNNAKISVKQLEKDLGYNSAGHLYADLNALKNDGIIDHSTSTDEISLTEKGKNVTKLYRDILIYSIVLTTTGVGYFVIAYYMNSWIIYYSQFLSCICVICGIALIISFWSMVKEKVPL